MKKVNFDHPYQAAGAVDQGRMRRENQDRIILDREHGFFAVSDGMGGLRCGGEASTYVRDSLPELLEICIRECQEDTSALDAAEHLSLIVRMLSDELYRKGNTGRRFDYGATLAGVWMYRDQAIYVGLGDSRGYLLPKDADALTQVTEDMNVAGILVRNGQMTKEEAAASPASCQLTAFVGMEAPATPETYLRAVQPGDTLLLCSDGLHGMVPEAEIVSILRENADPDTCCKALIDAANRHGGRDNISAVVIRVE